MVYHQLLCDSQCFPYADLLSPYHTGIYQKSTHFNIQITLIQYTQKCSKILSQVMGLYLSFSDYGHWNAEKKPRMRLLPTLPPSENMTLLHHLHICCQLHVRSLFPIFLVSESRNTASSFPSSRRHTCSVSHTTQLVL